MEETTEKYKCMVKEMIDKEKQKKAIRKYKRTHCFSYGDIPLKEIKLCISDRKINQIIKKEKYALTDFDIDQLKTNIYLKTIKDEKSTIEFWLYSKHLKTCEQFDKRFWEEYVYNYEVDYNLQDNYREYVKRIKYLDKIKTILDEHPEYHGLTGEQLQEKYNDYLDGTYITFSWRGWGDLMAAYMNSKIKKRKYHYMDFYM